MGSFNEAFASLMGNGGDLEAGWPGCYSWTETLDADKTNITIFYSYGISDKSSRLNHSLSQIDCRLQKLLSSQTKLINCNFVNQSICLLALIDYPSKKFLRFCSPGYFLMIMSVMFVPLMISLFIDNIMFYMLLTFASKKGKLYFRIILTLSIDEG